MDKYQEFLEQKSFAPVVRGLINVPALHPAMFPHQSDVTSWALRLGSAAAFLGTGMGKTLIELEWARVIAAYTCTPVLLLAPLAVAQQTVEKEAPKFGIENVRLVRCQADVRAGINVANYERLESFNPQAFDGVVLDESSILKSFDGRTRQLLIDAFERTPYKLAATATPAPNDYMELGNHAEFLGVMTAAEMLAMFFVHDGGETQKWRLKGHARRAFWKWVCSWAVSMRKPSDVGYSDEGFILPPKYEHFHTVEAQGSDEYLFTPPAATLQERITARRDSISERIEQAMRVIAAEPDEQWLIWCNLNSEQDELARRLGSDCVSIYGSLQPDAKIALLNRWLAGEKRHLVTKPSMFGYGLNLQNSARQLFVGVNDSWEQFYQAVRRSWRFGQQRDVHIHIVAASNEGNVVDNLHRKEKDAEQMAEEMAANTQDLTRMNLVGTARTSAEYVRDYAEGNGWKLHLADCVELARELESNSIHYSIFSPPFETLYTYSNSDRDMGNSRTSEEFWEHYRFLVAEQFRVMMPGRLVSIHCMNLPTSKVVHGHIGLRDFRGEIIRAYEAVGFIYHSEVCIWKDPVTAMQRTKALGLLHKQIKKDSCMSRQGVPDYLVTMRKPGDNAERVSHTSEEFPVRLWQEYASPVWMDINASDTLQRESAREHEDERHICPLQLEVIRRGIKLWSNPGDVVWSPFAGIGSEGFIAIREGRQFIGSELKRSYWEQAGANLDRACWRNAEIFAAD